MKLTVAVLPELFHSFNEISALVDEFERGALPRAQWTHRAHLTVACWYLLCCQHEEAIDRVRLGIQSYNRKQGIVTTENSGYHETMTLFWIRIVRHHFAQLNYKCPLVCLFNDVLLQYAAKDLPFTYYSRARLFSPEARQQWVEPDLQPLP